MGVLGTSIGLLVSVFLDRIYPSTICRSYPRGMAFGFHRAGGAGWIFWIIFYSVSFRMKLAESNQPLAEEKSLVSKLWFKSGLFTNFVGRNSVEDSMSLDRNGFYIICVYRMICPLTQKSKFIFFKVSYQITPLDRHPEPLLEVAQSGRHLSVFPFSVAYKPEAFH